jgi:type II secretory ATPase GspE/PulE/Tfp pilus assembly ATPase PilB-like protein
MCLKKGRIQELNDESIEMRLSTFPTVFGEKAVVRLFVGSGRYRHREELGLPADAQTGLNDLLLESGGGIGLWSGRQRKNYHDLRLFARISKQIWLAKESR